MPVLAKTAKTLRKFQFIPWSILALSGAAWALTKLLGA